MKLVLPTTLPSWLEKVIVLDADVIIASNIAELWNYFNEFSHKNCLAMAENQSPWYLGQVSRLRPWPALGRGFNSGVILVRLDRLRRLGWSSFWRRVTKRHMAAGYEATALADQDVLNAVLAARPSMLYRLPCQWNVQLGDSADSERCYRTVQELKIIHWNSPQKVASHRHRHIRYFRALYYTFLQYDGNLLRRELLACSTNSNNIEAASGSEELLNGPDDECYEMRSEQHLVRRTHIYYMDYNFTSSPHEVTLVSQLSVDRLQLLESLASRWEGPMSLAVHLSDAEARQLIQFVRASEVLRFRRNIAYHLVYKQGQFYPVNQLRNVALLHAPSEYVFLIDFDFLPSTQLYTYLREQVALLSTAQTADDAGTSHARVALVVPAFETFQYKMTFPSNKAELLERLNLGQVSAFRRDVWPAAHSATDYARWRVASRPYFVSWEAEYEPYVVLPKRAAMFDTRFVGFGWNKVAFVMELDILGYQFKVLPNAFVIHLPHSSSLDLARFRSSHLYRKCIYRLKVEYIKHLAKKHGVRALKYLSFRSDSP